MVLKYCTKLLPHITSIDCAFKWEKIVLDLFRFVYLVYGEFEEVVDHPRNKTLEVSVTFFQTGVVIDLDEPAPLTLVYHEIKPEKLKTVLRIGGAQSRLGALKNNFDDFFDLPKHYLLPVNPRVAFLELFKQGFNRDDVSLLFGAVGIRVVLLDGIVSKVDKLVVYVLKITVVEVP